MLPPPEDSYASLEDLLEAVNSFAYTQGYAVVKRRSDAGRVTLKCDRGGIYDKRNAPDTKGAPRHRHSATRLSDCPFRLYGRVLKADGQWHLKICNGQHNHEASDIAGHPVARRLRADERTTVARMISSGIAPKNILSTLRMDNPNTQVISQTIYNERVRLRKSELYQRPSLMCLIDILQEAGYNFGYQCNAVDELTHLFYAHPACVKLVEKFPYTVVIDCTYKTNRFKMPMLHVVGMTSFNTSFTVAVAFLQEETELYYQWSLEQLATLFQQQKPITITTDRELALINTLPKLFFYFSLSFTNQL
jgi:hypothetical protein